jgi:hypothetical protein
MTLKVVEELFDFLLIDIGFGNETRKFIADETNVGHLFPDALH